MNGCHLTALVVEPLRVSDSIAPWRLLIINHPTQRWEVVGRDVGTKLALEGGFVLHG